MSIQTAGSKQTASKRYLVLALNGALTLALLAGAGTWLASQGSGGSRTTAAVQQQRVQKPADAAAAPTDGIATRPVQQALAGAGLTYYIVDSPDEALDLRAQLNNGVLADDPAARVPAYDVAFVRTPEELAQLQQIIAEHAPDIHVVDLRVSTVGDANP